MPPTSRGLETCLHRLQTTAKIRPTSLSRKDCRQFSMPHTSITHPARLPPTSPRHPPPSRRTFSSTASRPIQSADDTPPTHPPRFTYRAAASFCGKQHAFNASTYYYTFSSSPQPHLTSPLPISKQTRRIPSGQDACFISSLGPSSSPKSSSSTHSNSDSNTLTSGIAFGLADGVGGWADQGIDPSDFSHGLCARMGAAAEGFGGEKEDGVEAIEWARREDLPRRVLQEAFDGVTKDESIAGGGSTACVAVVDWWGRLRVANLGDSGFTHIRLSSVLHTSPHQTHAFNTPFQLSQIPPQVRRQVREFGGDVPLGDQPADAALSAHTLQHGDVVIMATDGVWDNLSEEEILGVVRETCRGRGVWQESASSASEKEKDVKLSNRNLALATRDDKTGAGREKPLQAAIATAIVAAAKKAGLDEKRDGPFARAVQKAYPWERYHGGKPDDVCVVVLVALEDGKVDVAKL